MKRMVVSGREVGWVFKQVARMVFVRALSFDMHLRIAAMRGWLICALRKVPKDVVDNIQAAFPEREPTEINRIARGFCEYARRVYLWRVLPSLPGSNAPEKWPVVGLAHLDAALSRKRGVILVTAHFGYGHIIPIALAAHGYAVARVLAELERVEERERVEEWLRRGGWLRRRFYARTRVLADPLRPEDMVANLDVRPIFDRLSRNGIVMTTGDGLRSSHFTNLPLLGNVYPFPSGLMKIAMLTEASILPTFAVQDGRAGRIQVEIHPALAIDPRSDVRDNLRLLAEVIEEQLRERPHLWYRWMVPNWFQVALEWSKSGRESRYKSQLREVL